MAPSASGNRSALLVAGLAAILVLGGCATRSSPSPEVATASPAPSTTAPTPVATPTPAAPTPIATPVGISADRAIDLARAEIHFNAAGDVTSVKAGPFSELGFRWMPSRTSPWPAPDRWVWLVTLRRASEEGNSGANVVLDYFDGRIIQVAFWIA